MLDLMMILMLLTGFGLMALLTLWAEKLIGR